MVESCNELCLELLFLLAQERINVVSQILLLLHSRTFWTKAILQVLICIACYLRIYPDESNFGSSKVVPAHFADPFANGRQNSIRKAQ